VTTEGALQIPDGAWRIEIVRRGQTHWYRVVHGNNTIDWPSISAVEGGIGASSALCPD
jgi:hypothetical protein